MLSKNKRFLFIHVIKTAGTSMREVLFPFASAQHAKGDHATVADYQHLLGPAYKGFFSFGFVRNPYDWLVSTYENIRSDTDHHEHAIVSELTFAEFIERCIAQGSLKQSDWLYYEGEIGVDFVGRFETLEADFDLVRRALNLRARLSHRLESKGRCPWQDYYTPETQSIVQDVWADDFRNFGYSTALDGQEPEDLAELHHMTNPRQRMQEIEHISSLLRAG